MKVLMVNSVCGYGSTGRIAADIARNFLLNGDECFFAYGRGDVPNDLQGHTIKIGSRFDFYMHILYTRLTGKHGLASSFATKKFLRWVDNYHPDLIWLHNIHGYYINYQILFKWLKSHSGIQVKWTLHDEWAFTGHCGCYNAIKCDKWKVLCDNCPQIREYPASFFVDNSKSNFIKKRAAFSELSNLSIVAPSYWLRDQIMHSFLKRYPVEVCHNKVDTHQFKPSPSNFRKIHHIEDKFIILGVATAWQKCKGLYDFVELANQLDDSYQVVMVGLKKKQLTMISEKIIGIERTNDVRELAEIYSEADVFVNPTIEDNFPNVNIEALSCGTPVITYRTGGSPEAIDESCGIVVEENTVNALLKAIKKVYVDRPFTVEACLKRSRKFSQCAD